MERTERVLMGVFLLVTSMGLLGWHLWITWGGDQAPLFIQEKMLTPHDEFFSIHMGRSGQGWVVGNYGLVLHTKDGGKSWEKQATGVTEALTAVSFVDDQNGFAGGSGGTILATIDGGLSWKVQASGTKDRLLGVQALSRSKVFAVGAFGTILYSSDGGASWRKWKLSWEKLIPRLVEESGYMEPNLNGVFFVTPEKGWIVGEFGLVLHTADGGQTWISQRYGGDLPELVDVIFRGECVGWAIGQSGTFIKTMDGGRRWLEVNIGTKQGLYGISVYDERAMIVGGGVVFKTDDGGSSWVRVKSFSENRWLNGVALTKRGAITVGQAGALQLIDLDEFGSDKRESAR